MERGGAEMKVENFLDYLVLKEREGCPCGYFPRGVYVYYFIFSQSGSRYINIFVSKLSRN